MGENIAVPSYSGASLSKQSEHVLMIKPTCGTLAMFTSDARNMHGTYPVTSGERFALPMWFTSHRSLPRTSKQRPFKMAELVHIEDAAWSACERSQNEFPPPSGLMDESIDGDCDKWLDSLRNPTTLLPYRYKTGNWNLMDQWRARTKSRGDKTTQNV